MNISDNNLSDIEKNDIENNFFQWIKSYLYDEIIVPTQFVIKNNINMCCGIGYLAIKHQNHLISAYLSKDEEKYIKVFTILMKIASDRKLNNPAISIDGEFLDEPTIKNDFLEIYSNMDYYEFIVGEFYEDNKKKY